jgi:glycosyltransferase involved in cell wall biosynthesis
MKFEDNIITVFLGLYNAEKYLSNLFTQINSQTNQNFNLLVVDNNSSDTTYENVKIWQKMFGERMELIRNPINYGGYGSIFNNIGKIKTPWFCWFHQDDFYKPDHVSTLLEMISCGNETIIGACTTMGSLANNGKILNSKPRMTWFASETDQAGQFLQNLKSQAFPDPASAYRLDIFKKTIIPFHSTSFPDTEHILRMLGYGTFLVSEKETILYRENPSSDSHVLNANERIIGAAVGLIRVFNSVEFNLILNTITQDKRRKFASQLLDALGLRFPDSEVLKVIEISVLEKLLLTWGYGEKNVAELLLKKYSAFSSPLTIRILSNLSKLKYSDSATQTSRLQEHASRNSRIWDFYFNLTTPLIKKNNKIIIKIIYQIIFIFKPKHRFRNRW